MSNLLRSELFKLRKDRSFRTLLAVLGVISLLYPLLIFYDDGTFSAAAVSVRDVFAGPAIGGDFYVLRMAPCVFAGFFISSEYAIGTMKTIGASGNGRLRIFWAKLTVFTLGTVVLAAVFPILSTGICAFVTGFRDMPGVGEASRLLGLTLLFAAAFASIMALCAIVLTDSGKTIGLLILFFILFDIIMTELAKKFAWIATLQEYSVLHLLDAIPAADAASGMTARLILVPVATYAAFACLGGYVFRKKEIK
ncbi:ABC transporter permease [Paenibacillus glycinis]|uniref:ABC transporter permease subunit n=1 Tax=Paenibacillus glycinis TaxID=2697035 RepID=A0ABW9XRF5_9BACL|nr:ABC transporter permease [Paenibacillus glycinis]NBD25210.1 ABC transporter permease subunit [Paenibacillus glycinis]